MKMIRMCLYNGRRWGNIIISDQIRSDLLQQRKSSDSNIFIDEKITGER